MEMIIYGIKLPKSCKENWCKMFAEEMELSYFKNGDHHYFGEMIVAAEKDQIFTLTDVMSILKRKQNELLDWNPRFLASVQKNIQKYDKFFYKTPSLFIIHE
jgi:hypothetical protein